MQVNLLNKLKEEYEESENEYMPRYVIMRDDDPEVMSRTIYLSKVIEALELYENELKAYRKSCFLSPIERANWMSSFCKTYEKRIFCIGKRDTNF